MRPLANLGRADAHMRVFDRMWSCLPYLRPMATVIGDSIQYGIDADGAGCHDLLGTRWGVVGHLLGVRNSTELRAAHEAVQPEVVVFALRLAQSKPVFDALAELEKSAAFANAK